MVFKSDFTSANPKEVATGIIRGAFEFQGQKCSAASRVYLPQSLAEKVIAEVKSKAPRMIPVATSFGLAEG